MTHPLATDLVEFVEEQPAEMRHILAHIACCEPCRLGVVNIIQSADGYPDLFARQPASGGLSDVPSPTAPDPRDEIPDEECCCNPRPPAGVRHSIACRAQFKTRHGLWAAPVDRTGDPKP